jgi:putative protein-disulfide isomerase
MPPPGRLEGTYYTDPLCSWSWAFEAPWRRLRRSLGDRLAVRTAMGGLLPDWRSFSDSVNDIHRPAQMAPAWISVAELSGMPIDEAVWRDDPPASSYPACVAVKAAERQSAAGAALYLRRLREAVMLDRRNIARRDVLLEIAGELAGDAPRALDLERFTRDLTGEAAGALFRDDLKEARYLGISRFPTLVLGRPGGRSAALVGYRPWSALAEAIAQMAPELEPLVAQPPSADPLDYALAWGRITAREAAEGVGIETAAAERALDEAAEAGRLRRSGHLFLAAIEPVAPVEAVAPLTPASRPPSAADGCGGGRR